MILPVLWSIATLIKGATYI